MKKKEFGCLLIASAVFGGNAPLAAQKVTAEHLFRPGSVAVSLYAGGAAFSPFQRSAVSAAGAPEYDRRVSAHTSTALGAEFMWWLSPSWGLRLHGSFLPSRFDVQQDAVEPRSRSLAAGDSTVWRGLNVVLADVSALIRPPFTFGRVAPYAIIGGGVVSYRPRGSGPLPPGLESAFGDGARTAFAGVAGIGAAVPLQRDNLILSFAVTDHVTRTPVPAGDEPLLPEPAAGTVVEVDAPVEHHDRVSITSNVRLMVGLTVPLRGRR